MQESRQPPSSPLITGGTPLQQAALAAVCALSPHQNFSLHCTPPLLTLNGTIAVTLKTPVRLKTLLESLDKIQGNTTLLVIHHSMLDSLHRTLTTTALPPLELTEKECAILCSLQQAFPAAVTKETLLESVWQYHPSTTTHTVETHVYRLRQKLENHGVSDFSIVTAAEGYIIKQGH